jgi:hypothetical protein
MNRISVFYGIFFLSFAFVINSSTTDLHEQIKEKDRQYSQLHEKYLQEQRVARQIIIAKEEEIRKILSSNSSDQQKQINTRTLGICCMTIVILVVLGVKRGR